MPGWLEANFTGTAADAADYTLTASVTPELLGRIGEIHGELLGQAIRQALTADAQ